MTYKFSGTPDDVPDINLDILHDFPFLFQAIQNLIQNELVLAGHDISDGGMITAILEMCFAGNFGCNIDLTSIIKTLNKETNSELALRVLFSEQPGTITKLH